MPRRKRKWQPRELKMLHEYLAKYHANDIVMTRIRLGSHHPELIIPGLEESELRLIGVFRRWADAVIIQPDKLILMEAKILPEPGVISQLELYEFLLPHTPELQPYLPRPIEKQLLFAIEDPAVITLCHQHGIIPIMYRPSWIEEYINELYPRMRRGKKTFPLPEGEE